VTRILLDQLACTVCGVPVNLAWSLRTGLTVHPPCQPQAQPATPPEPERVRPAPRTVEDEPPAWFDPLDAAEDAAGDALTPRQLAAATGTPPSTWQPTPRPPRPLPARPRAVTDPRDLPPQHPDTGTSTLRTTVGRREVAAWTQARQRRAEARATRRATTDVPDPDLIRTDRMEDGIRIDPATLDVLADREHENL
jgi:hypothetical protein